MFEAEGAVILFLVLFNADKIAGWERLGEANLLDIKLDILDIADGNVVVSKQVVLVLYVDVLDGF